MKPGLHLLIGVRPPDRDPEIVAEAVAETEENDRRRIQTVKGLGAAPDRFAEPVRDAE
jgi:hypothetical protein